VAGRVPSRGELIDHPSGIEIEIVDADLRRVKWLRIRRLRQPDGDDPGEAGVSRSSETV
jgi:CBS domain containing-hemolysin-like protein